MNGRDKRRKAKKLREKQLENGTAPSLSKEGTSKRTDENAPELTEDVNCALQTTEINDD